MYQVLAPDTWISRCKLFFARWKVGKWSISEKDFPNAEKNDLCSEKNSLLRNIQLLHLRWNRQSQYGKFDMFWRVSQEYVNSALLTACLHWFPWDPEPLVLVPRRTIPLFPIDSESLPKVCYINWKNSENLSKLRISEPGGASGLHPSNYYSDILN